MIKAGCHLSTSKGYLNMAKEAVSINADTFQFFSRNPRGGNAKKIDEKDCEEFEQYRGLHNITKILVHAPYTLNPCSKDAGLREFAERVMLEDLERTDYFSGCMYNFHPGSHTGLGTQKGIELISGMLNRILEKYTGKTEILLETMAGKGTEVGRTFEELAMIINQTEQKQRIGICMDTCHVFDGGYDLNDNLGGVLSEFDTVIGLEKLKAIHINDSMNPVGSHKDRHAQIGKGNISMDTFTKIVNDERLSVLPFYLETPNDIEGYRKEISLLKSLCEKK